MAYGPFQPVVGLGDVELDRPAPRVGGVLGVELHLLDDALVALLGVVGALEGDLVVRELEIVLVPWMRSSQMKLRCLLGRLGG